MCNIKCKYIIKKNLLWNSKSCWAWFCTGFIKFWVIRFWVVLCIWVCFKQGLCLKSRWRGTVNNGIPRGWKKNLHYNTRSLIIALKLYHDLVLKWYGTLESQRRNLKHMVKLKPIVMQSIWWLARRFALQRSIVTKRNSTPTILARKGLSHSRLVFSIYHCDLVLSWLANNHQASRARDSCYI